MVIRKQFKAEMAHRLVSSYSKDCQNFHGHSYLFEVILEAETVNCDAMLMDFGEVKNKAKAFMDYWDHCMVLADFDPVTPRMIDIMEELDMKHIIVPYNPTAEMMAVHMYQQLHEYNLPVKSVRVHETTTGWAEFDGTDEKIFVDLDRVVIHA